jgi:hypothetical protein
MQTEVKAVRGKREELEGLLQEAKTIVCQQGIQMRQMQSTVDSQGLEIAAIGS